MQINRKNGINLDEIIKSASKKLIRPINYNNAFNFNIKAKLTKAKNNNRSKERTTVNSDEDYAKNAYETQSN